MLQSDVTYTVRRHTAQGMQVVEVTAKTNPPSERVVGVVRVEVPVGDHTDLQNRYPLHPGAHAAAKNDIEDLALALCARAVDGVADEARICAPS